MNHLREITRRFKREIRVYRRIHSHPRTPRLARWTLGLAVGYAVMPFDLIPDFIPVIGHLDDMLILPLLVFLALRMVPTEVVAECRAEETSSEQDAAGF